MRSRWTFLCAGLALFVGAHCLWGAAPDATGAINRHVAAGWEAARITPAPVSDDAEFLRRVYLDLNGRIPGVTEARQFLDDKRADKRERLVDRLLASQNYANHFTEYWRTLLIPEAATSLQARFQQPAFKSWLRGHLVRNTGYDRIVRELITAPLSGPGPFTAGIGVGNDEPAPSAFFFAKEMMPENLAAATSRVFLGVKLECAQCHNHPFATWKRDEFWSFAAFYAGVKRQGPGEIVVAGREDTARREIAIPNTDRKVSARFLNGREPDWKDGVSPRETLADWLTAADNPYFARATVNRMWQYFFGTGLIDPVDEMVGGQNEASHPELLNELGKAFAASKFDLKFLIRSIVLSKPYQLSSRSSDGSNGEARLFGRMPLRGLTAEQLFDSLSQAIGHREPSSNLPPEVVLAGRNNARAEFLARFAANNDKATDHQTSILQALALMNGRLVAEGTSLDRSTTLSGVLDAPFFDDAGRLETLYLAALSRRPTKAEIDRLTGLINEHTRGASGAAERQKRHQEALADVFWALLNSSEFMLNH